MIGCMIRDAEYDVSEMWSARLDQKYTGKRQKVKVDATGRRLRRNATSSDAAWGGEAARPLMRRTPAPLHLSLSPKLLAPATADPMRRRTASGCIIWHVRRLPDELILPNGLRRAGGVPRRHHQPHSWRKLVELLPVGGIAFALPVGTAFALLRALNFSFI